MARRKEKPERRRGFRERIVGTREERVAFLIVCEGEETEPNYFNALRIDLRVQADVRVRGTGFNTLSLVEEAIRLRDAEGGVYDQVWCVFDKDDFTDEAFNAAVKMAEDNKCHAAYSNAAFELWLVLHYQLHQSGSHHSEYRSKLDKHLKKKYEKNDPDLFHATKDKLDTAKRNAEKLHQRRKDPSNPALNNPSTTVHLLVEQLQKYKLR